MIEDDKKRIRKGLPPRRDEACFQVQRDIVIPAGTILRSATVNRGSIPEMAANVGIAPGVEGYFSVDDVPETCASGVFKRVVA